MKKTVTVLAIFLILSSLCLAQSFSDLDRVMERNNAKVRLADESLKQAQLDSKDAKASFSPSITFSGSATYMTEPLVGPIVMESGEILSQMGLGAYSDLASGYVTLFDGMDNTIYMGTLSLTQPLVTWGKLTTAVSLYESIESAQGYRREDTIASSKAELRIRLWSLKYLYELDALLREAMEISGELVDISKNAYENGMLLRQDWLKARTESLEVEVKLLDMEGQLSSVRDGLVMLLGGEEVELDEIDFPEESSLFHKYDEKTLDHLVAAATGEGSNNLKAIKNLIGAYSSQKKIAERSLYGIPDFALQADFSYTATRLPFIEKGWKQNDNTSLNLSIGFKTNLWDGGKAINSLEKAKSNIRSAEAQYDDASLQLSSGVKSNWSQMKMNLSSLEMLELKVENLEEELSALETEMEYGQKSRSDWLQKKLELSTAKGELIATKIALVQNVYTLDYLTGELNGDAI